MEKKEQRTSHFARVSLVCGIVGLVLSLVYGGIIGIIGLVYGIFSFANREEEKVQASIGIVASVASIGVTVLMVLLLSFTIRTGVYGDMEKMMKQGNYSQEDISRIEQKIRSGLQGEGLVTQIPATKAPANK